MLPRRKLAGTRYILPDAMHNFPLSRPALPQIVGITAGALGLQPLPQDSPLPIPALAAPA